jgi:Signal transduction histidine kinase
MADALEAKIAALSAAQARELRFTANVAHELRTPLTALVAEASLLGSQVSHLPDPARRPVELLVADVRRLRTLVDELMEISRLDAGSEPVLRRRVDVRSVVAALISARGWQDQWPCTGPLTLTTDPRRIERILANLVGNAVEHSGRDVTVRTGTDGAHGCIDVADGGPGIPPEHLPHVFERFTKPTRHGPAWAAVSAWLSRSRTPGSWAEISACPVTWQADRCSGSSCRSGPRRCERTVMLR